MLRRFSWHGIANNALLDALRHRRVSFTMKQHNKSRFAIPIPLILTSITDFYCKRFISQGYYLLTKCHLFTAAP
jgi:hypothetical protein